FMPEHAHLIVRPRGRESRVAAILKAVKQPVGRRAFLYLESHALYWLPPDPAARRAGRTAGLAVRRRLPPGPGGQPGRGRGARGSPPQPGVPRAGRAGLRLGVVERRVAPGRTEERPAPGSDPAGVVRWIGHALPQSGVRAASEPQPPRRGGATNRPQ